jgi:spore germination protein GerM
MNKKLISMLCIVGCIVVISGCGKMKQTAVVAASATPEVTQSATPAPSETPEAVKSVPLKLYFGNAEGDSLVSKAVTLEPAKDKTIYLEALNELTKSTDDQNVALFAGFTFLSAEINNGTLTINLKLPEESQLGAPGEELLLDSLKKTMFQFAEINAIEVLVNGEKVESLLGHMDLPHPITK